MEIHDLQSSLSLVQRAFNIPEITTIEKRTLSLQAAVFLLAVLRMT